MSRNVLIATSTNTQRAYDVNVCRLPFGMELADWWTIPPASRLYHHVGRYSMVQILYALWPLLNGIDAIWQEFYIFQNNFPADPPNSATINTRHSMCPTHWMQIVVGSMRWGKRFYSSFWDFTVPAVWFAGGLNYVDYVLAYIDRASGPHMLLWPTMSIRGPKAFPLLLDLIYETLGSEIPVPFEFVKRLCRLYDKWQPRLEHGAAL